MQGILAEVRGILELALNKPFAFVGVAAALLILSEALPFIKHVKSNGLLQMFVSILRRRKL